MTGVIAGILVLLGAVFAVVAGLGLLRLPDVLTRMHASTKAGALGCSLIVAAAAAVFGESGVTVRAVAIVAFLLLTAPIAAHMIGRAAWRTGVPLWKGSEGAGPDRDDGGRTQGQASDPS